MKLKNYVTFITVAFIAALLLPVNVLAADVILVEQLDVASTTIDADQNSGLVAFMRPQNVFGTLKVNGTGPGAFQEIDFQGNDWTDPWGGTLTDYSGERLEDEEYPYSFGMAGMIPANPGENPWDVSWFKTDNNTELLPTDSDTYNYRFEINRLGELSLGAFKSFTCDVVANKKWYEIDFTFLATGLFTLEYNQEANINNKQLISPNGVNIDLEVLTQPEATSTGDSLTNKLLMIIPSVGVYRFYFTTDVQKMNFKLERPSTEIKIISGDNIRYQEEENPTAETMYSSGDYLLNIYPFDATAYEPLSINYKTIWSDPTAMYYIMDSETDYVQSDGLTDQHEKNLIMPEVTGEGIIVVRNNKYISWTGAGGIYPIRDLSAYSLSIGEIEVETHTIGTEKTYTIEPADEKKIITINASSHKGILLNGSKKSGNPTCIDLTPAGSLIREDIGGATTVNEVSNHDGLMFFDLTPGIYYMELRHSLGKDEVEYYTIESVDVTEGQVIPHTSFDIDTILDFTDNKIFDGTYDLGAYTYPFDDYPYDSSPTKILKPKLYNFAYNNYIGSDVVVQLYREDNPDIFEKTISQEDMLIWVYNGSDYINLTDFSSALDLM
ncbi:MAG: hypothetical protein GY870_00935, partial [archaeon]|nr:hypothetical protein [archaeon]